MKRKFSITITSQHDTKSLAYYVLYDGTEEELIQKAGNGHSLELVNGGRLALNGKLTLTLVVKEES